MSRARRGELGWTWATAAIAAVVALPLVALLVLASERSGSLWPHLVANVLPDAVATTTLLLAGVGLVTAVIGVGSAWLVTMFRFPGRDAFEWLLALPLAIPVYITAYSAIEILDTLGPVQSSLRAVFGWRARGEYVFPEIRSLGGAVAVMGLSLYPYVYLSVRASLIAQPAAVLEVARTLGKGPWDTFRTIALPLCRPAVAAGTALAMLEALNDLGAAQFFAVQTLTVSVYSTWVSRGSLAGAAQIACVMLLAVFALMALERFGRRRLRYHVGRGRAAPRRPLGPFAGAAAALACAAPVALGFAAPTLFLAHAAWRRLPDGVGLEYLALAARSFALAFGAALLTVLLGVVLAYGARLTRHHGALACVRVATIGYAVPGAVLAIGIFVPLAGLDNLVDGLARSILGVSTGLLLSGTAFGLLLAYAVRFLAVSHGAIETGLGRVTPHLDMASRSLGRTAAATLREIHVPLLRPALATAALLVFVEVVKELPATLLLRPFNFETLATFVYGAASRESVEEGALAALTIILIGLAPIILLTRTAGTYGSTGSRASSWRYRRHANGMATK